MSTSHHAFYSTAIAGLPLPKRGAEHFAVADCHRILHRLAGISKKGNVLLVHPRGAITGWVEHLRDDRFQICNGSSYTEFSAKEVSIKNRPPADPYSHAIVARDAQKGGAA